MTYDHFGDADKRAQAGREELRREERDRRQAKVAPFVVGGLLLAGVVWWQWPNIATLIHNH